MALYPILCLMKDSVNSKDLELRSRFIEYGISRLKRFGFINVTAINILEDDVYKFYFFRFLLDRLGENQNDDVVIKNLIIEISNGR